MRISDWSSDVCSSDLSIASPRTAVRESPLSRSTVRAARSLRLPARDAHLGSSSSSSLEGNILSEQTHLVTVRRAKQLSPQNGHLLAPAQLAAGDVEAGSPQIHPRDSPPHPGEEIRTFITTTPDPL